MGRFVFGVVVFVLQGEAGEATPKVRSDVAILLSAQGEDVVPGPIWYGIKTTVSSIFGKVGVPVVWHKANVDGQVSDRRFPILIQIAARLSPTMQERGPTCADAAAFACSWPFEMSTVARIIVMYERVRALSVRPRLFQPLFSYLIAHEIAHILEGRGDHSDCGIMKHHWAAADLEAIENARLTFTARDVGLIQEGLTSHVRRH